MKEKRKELHYTIIYKKTSNHITENLHTLYIQMLENLYNGYPFFWVHISLLICLVIINNTPLFSQAHR